MAESGPVQPGTPVQGSSAEQVVRLTALLDQSEADLRLVEQVGQALGSQLNVERLHEEIYDQIRTALTVDTFYIVLAEAGAATGHFPMFVDGGVRYAPRDNTLGPLIRWVIDNGQALLFSDVYEEALKVVGQAPINYGQRTSRARSWLGVPLTVRGQVKGVLSVQSYKPGLYGARERRLMGLIASLAAVAIENARLFEQVRHTVEELSTPIVPVHEGVLILPLVGAIDSRRADRITEALLDSIEKHNARAVIIDITGVSTVDSQVGQSLLRAARAARLLGTQTVLSGIHPDVAESIVTIGLNLSELATCSDLQSAIEYALTLRRLPAHGTVYARPVGV